MVYTIRDDKSAFFNAAEPWTLKSINDYVCNAKKPNNYAFVLNNYTELETEFQNLFKELELLKEDDEKKDIFWFFCYYRCQQLILFYGTDKPGEEAYHKPDELEKHEILASRIKRYFEACDVLLLAELPNLTTPQLWPLNSDSAYIVVNNVLYYVRREAGKGTIRKINISLQQFQAFNQIIGVNELGKAKTLSRKELHAIRAKIDLKNDTESLLRKCFNEFRYEFIGLIKIPTQISEIKCKLGLLNLWRVYWVFCRLMVTSGLRYFREAHLIEKFEALLGKPFNEVDFIRKIEAPNVVFNVLSVALFAARFLLNAAQLIKHVCFPKGAAKQTTWSERFLFEIYKRNAVFLNDGAWATVNLLTNYPAIIHISTPVALWLTAGFLVFDFSVILWQRFWAEREYRRMREHYKLEMSQYITRQAQLAHEIEALIHQEVDGQESDAIKAKLAAKIEEQKLINQQIALNIKCEEELKLNWKVKNATFCFNAVAAVLLTAGFTAAFLFASPVIALVAYAVSMVAVAMYLSGNAYSHYKEKSLRFYAAHHEYDSSKKEHNGPGLQYIRCKNESLRDYQAARKAFWLTMARNVVIPTVMIALLAVCWQAAVAFAVLYVGYKLYQHVHTPQKAPKEQEELLPQQVPVLS